jgi:glyoxylase I family protein
MKQKKNKNETIGGGGFHHVAMKVRDFDASVKFYTELGFKETISWGEGNKQAMMLDTGDGNYLEIFAGGSAEPATEGGYIHVAFRTDNCDQAIERAKKAGAEVTIEPKDVDIPSRPTLLKVRIAFCKGPSGEVIEFFQDRAI